MAEPRKQIVLVGVSLLLLATSLFAADRSTNQALGLGGYDEPFFPEGTYDTGVSSPSEFLGFPLGSRPAAYEETLAYLSYLNDNFSNAFLMEYGSSYERRKLYYLTVTSERNARDLDAIRARIVKLADPRLLASEQEAKKIIDSTPAVAWMAYAIHGDELSSTDAALQLAYQLVAGTDEMTGRILDNTIVCIDPLQNPDGRERWLTQLEQWNGVVPNMDTQSLHHTGFWPQGRGNHYLFDLNRDWFTLVHPESRGKVEAIKMWNPQFFVDCHEMGSHDTYLFSPPREPFNPYMIRQIHKWWDIVALDQAKAFDEFGWSYYTREWNEEFFPGYGSSWSIYLGAIGMLYEQAGVDGSLVRRTDGTVMTYRETVHHQFISSLANLHTVASHRGALLEDFYREKKRAVGLDKAKRRGKSRESEAYVFPPSPNRDRFDHFAETLTRQGIEVEVSEEASRLRRARSADGEIDGGVDVPAGSYIVRLNQPLRHLIEVILSFDIRISTAFLEKERKELLKHNRSKVYDATAWSLPIAYNLTGYYTEKLPDIETVPFRTAEAGNPRASGGLAGTSPKFGFVFDGTDDSAYQLLARLLERGYKIYCARESFEVDGNRYGRGSWIIPRNANPDLVESDLHVLAEAEGVHIRGVNSALAQSGPDLGSHKFQLLVTPRIALLGGAVTSSYSFGTVWHLLDNKLRYNVSTLDLLSFARWDLRKYNVIVLPEASRGAAMYKQLLGDEGNAKLKTWMENGGTLVVMGGGAAFAADTSVALTSVRQRRQVLKDLARYETALRHSKSAERPYVDSLAVWEGEDAEDSTGVDEAKDVDVKSLEAADEVARRLRPRGAILRTDLDATHWLTFGIESPLPVFVYTSFVYLADKNVEVAARFSPSERLRLAGLVWPEGRERWGESVYATREAVGNGQIVLFAGQPNFRGYFYDGERLLLNAIFLGPGFGARPPDRW
jgi:hypothetical protein